MKQYIDKSALVAEIESLRCTTFTNFDEGVNATVQTLLEVIDTLEVKEDVVLTDTTSPNSLKISRHGNSHIEAMTEALRTEYEKGRADAIGKAYEFLKDFFEEYENLTDYNPTEDFKNYMNRHEG